MVETTRYWEYTCIFSKMRKHKKNIQGLIGKSIDKLLADDNKVILAEDLELSAEDICIYFNDGSKLNLCSLEYPHFDEDGRIDFEYLKSIRELELLTPKDHKITKIKIWEKPPYGLNFFSRKNLMQIEFHLENGSLLSIGFFNTKNETSNFISTGELYILGKPINKGFLASGIESFEINS